MGIISVVIADEHPFVVRGVSDFLKSAGDITVVEACFDGAHALRAIRALKPTVAILNISMPNMSGLEVLTTVNHEGISTRTVFLAESADTRDIVTAMAEGAYALLLKDSQPDELLRCIRDVAAGRKCLPFEFLEQSREMSNGRSSHVHVENLLTPREWKVMALAAEGLSNKEIAHRLNIMTGTAKIHLHHIYRKIGVKNRTALASIAFQFPSASARSLPKTKRLST